MTKPVLKDAGTEFKKLHTKGGAKSQGTVTGENISKNDAVDIVGKKSGKKWHGNVTSDPVSGKADAEVHCLNPTKDDERPKDTENIDVTVTNSSGPSNTVTKPDSDVVP
jgi:hypothetical protein